MVRVPPPLLALTAALAQRVLAGAAPAPSPVRITATAVVSATSVALAGSAATRFRRNHTTLDPLRPETASTLVTTGPYAVTRNPMYVGLAGLLVSHAIWRRSAVALLPAAGFVAAIDRFQIRVEESALAANFGAEFSAYREATPRWLDGRSLRRRSGPV